MTHVRKDGQPLNAAFNVRSASPIRFRAERSAARSPAPAGSGSRRTPRQTCLSRNTAAQAAQRMRPPPLREIFSSLAPSPRNKPPVNTRPR